MQFADVNGVVLHYQVISAAKDKPTLVFANSLGTDFRIWRDVIVRLAGDYSILTYDMRGHGLSDLGVTPYTIEDHVWDLAALLDHVEISEAIICGLSVGGVVAMGVQAARPELVKALILSDTATAFEPAELWDERIAAVEDGGMEPIADLVMERWFTEEFSVAKPLEISGYRNMFARQSAEGHMAMCVAIRDADMAAIAADIDVPTLCIVGAQDVATPVEVVRALSEKIDGARLEIVDEAGHLPCVEQPDIVTDLINQFCKALGDKR